MPRRIIAGSAYAAGGGTTAVSRTGVTLSRRPTLVEYTLLITWHRLPRRVPRARADEGEVHLMAVRTGSGLARRHWLRASLLG